MSNLPTVWTNVLAGVVLAGGSLSDPRLPLLLVALSLSYVAGMYLNDWFDRDIDGKQRPERPIPSGQVAANTVFARRHGDAVAQHRCCSPGSATAMHREPAGGPCLPGSRSRRPIVFYDWRHKGNPLSPVVMGLCRLLVYVTAAYAVVETPATPLWWAAILLLCYLIGLTYIAKQETLDVVRNLWPLAFLGLPIAYAAMAATESFASAVLFGVFTAWVAFALNYLRRRRPGDVPRAVVSSIAGISLLDAVFLCAAGAVGAAAVAVLGFLADAGAATLYRRHLI